MDTSNGSTLTVLLAGCSDVAGVGLRALLSADPRSTIVGETRGEVVRQAQRHRPDVIVLDPAAGGRLNVALVAELIAHAPQSRISIYTNYFEPRAFLDVMKAGGRAYMLKADADSTFVVDALMQVARYGATVIDPAVRTRFAAEAGDRLRLWLTPEPHEQCRLSAREHEVLALLAEGCSDQAIAAQLGISTSTVRSYVDRLCTKLEAATREQLMVLAVRHGLLDG
jgi:DNA-binding NarL/FixJ family response regulator